MLDKGKNTNPNPIIYMFKLLSCCLPLPVIWVFKLTESMTLPLLQFQTWTLPSKYPPPLARLPDSYGHHAKPFTVDLCFLNLVSGFFRLRTSHILTPLRGSLVATYLPLGFHLILAMGLLALSEKSEKSLVLDLFVPVLGWKLETSVICFQSVKNFLILVFLSSTFSVRFKAVSTTPRRRSTMWI